MKRNMHAGSRLAMTLIMCIMIIAGITSIFAVSAEAATTTVGVFKITGGTEGVDYRYTGGVLTILSSQPMTIDYYDIIEVIRVEKGVSADITLTAPSKITSYSKAPLDFSEAGNSTLTIPSGSPIYLLSEVEAPGIYTPKNARLTITGTGELVVQGGGGQPGVGTDGNGSILIDGPTVTATGGNNAAGIGGAWGSSVNVTIQSGTVTASGGTNGAGIGAGAGSSATAGGTIIINGGTVNATGGSHGAGIGSGWEGSCGNIIINGGTVKATGGDGGAGIGSGDGQGGVSADNGSITINGGTVIATAPDSQGNPAAIGGGGYKQAPTVKIHGGNVTATGSQKGLGSGAGAVGGSILIDGGYVTANGIGTGGYGSSVSTSIRDGLVVCTDTTNGGINKANQGSWAGLVVENGNGQVYGSCTLTERYTNNGTLTVPGGTTLTIAAGVIVTNNGTIQNNGAIINNGEIINSGSIKGNAVTGSGTVSNGITYLTCDSNGNNWHTALCPTGTYTNVTSSATTLGSAGKDTWYVVNSDVTIDGRITVSGNVHLILMNSYTMNANKGIDVQPDNSMTIYAQTTNRSTMGKLNATAIIESGIMAPAIGGEHCGNITFNGGMISTKSGILDANTIGGDQNTDGGVLTFNGGVVSASNVNTWWLGTAVGGPATEVYINGGILSTTTGKIICTNDTSPWRGLVSSDGACRVYGDITLAEQYVGEINARGSVTVPAETTIRVSYDSDLSVSGKIVNRGTIVCDGILRCNGTLENYSDVTGSGDVYFNTALQNDGAVSGSVKIHIMKDFWGSGTFIDSNTVFASSVSVPSYKTLTIPVGQTLTIPENTTLTNNISTININGTLTNNGIIQNKNGTLNASGTLTNNGNIQNENGILNASGTLTNNGTLQNNNVVDIRGTFNQNGIFNQNGHYLLNTYYHIYTLEDYLKFVEYVNKINHSANGMLMADLDLSEHQVTIAESGYSYSGIFDGNGHVLNIYYYDNGTVDDDNHTALSLFRITNRATFRNLGITGIIETNKTHIGVLGKGWDGNTVENCFSMVQCKRIGTDEYVDIPFLNNIYDCRVINSYAFSKTNGDTNWWGNTETFASGEVAWYLNTAHGSKTNTMYWSQGETHPVRADETHGAVVRAYINGSNTYHYYKAGNITSPICDGIHPGAHSDEGVITADTEIRLVNVPRKEPTCTEEGYETYWQCSLCGKMFSDAAGTTEIGKPVAIAKLPHTYGDWIAYIPGTETAHGTLGHYECSTCHHCFDTGYNEMNTLVTDHKYNEKGFCKFCGEYQPAVENADGYYEINNAGQLLWFSALTNGLLPDGSPADITANAILLYNIDLNPGYTFTFEADTGLVKVDGNGETFYLGTGMPGNIAFDTTASGRGTVYTYENGVYTETPTADDNLRVWTPIGSTQDLSYAGAFNGSGFTVSGMYVNRENSFTGFIGYMQDGSVEKLTVKNSYVRGGSYTGGIVGFSALKTSILDCMNEGTVVGIDFVGGIVGNIHHDNALVTHKRFINTGAVSGVSNVGGIAGIATYMSNAYNAGSVYASGSTAGGIGGFIGTRVELCYNTGTVTSPKYADEIQSNKPTESYYCQSLKGAESRLTSGEITYLLNGWIDKDIYTGEMMWVDGNYSPHFFQTLDKDVYPKFSGEKVYRFVERNCAGITQWRLVYGNDVPGNMLVNVPRKDATENETGYEEYWRCSDCGKLYSDARAENEISEPVLIPFTLTDIPYQAFNNGTFSSAVLETGSKVTGDLVRWNSGWYVAEGNVTISERVTVNGDVKLILTDGCNLTAYVGIEVPEGSTLTIYAQKNGTGILTAVVNTGSETRYAGIGGSTNANAGTINICGGLIIAQGTYDASGIGGGNKAADGSGVYGGFTAINIHGGTVIATGVKNGAAIGSGCWGGGTQTDLCIGTILIENAIVFAKTDANQEFVAAIGRGFNWTENPPCDVTIRNSIVYAENTSNGRPGNSISIAKGNDAPTIIDSIVTVNNGDNTAGNAILSGDYLIPSDKTVTIPAGAALTLAPDTLLTNNGTLTVCGTLNISGEVKGNQPVINGGTVHERLTVTYLPGTNGTGEALTDAIYNSAVLTFRGESFTRKDYSQTGWATSDGGAKVYELGQSYPVNESLILYPYWTAASVMTDVPYQTYDEIYESVHMTVQDTCNSITSDLFVWNSGWFVVADTVTITERITVNGDVKLILADGCTLNAEKGIQVPQGSTLTVYGQKEGTGTLKATAVTNGTAAIGGDKSCNAGTVNIYGGLITANGAYEGAGIGGGQGGSGNPGDGGFTAINIWGGTIIANGGTNAAAIGSGCWGGNEKRDDSIGTIRIKNAIVFATADANQSYVAAIGRGFNGAVNPACDVKIGYSLVYANNTSTGTPGNSISAGNSDPIEFAVVYVNNGESYKEKTWIGGSYLIPEGVNIDIFTYYGFLGFYEGSILTNYGTITSSEGDMGSIFFRGEVRNYGTVATYGGQIRIYSDWTGNLPVNDGGNINYHVNYAPGSNGTGAKQSDSFTYGNSLTLKDAIFTRDGYTQTGWSLVDGGEKTYDLGATYEAAEGLTLYPYWSRNSYPVVYASGTGDGIGGTIDNDAKLHDQPLTLSAQTFTRDGYIQIGWAISDGGEKVYDLSGSYTDNNAVTLYPVWTSNHYEISSAEQLKQFAELVNNGYTEIHATLTADITVTDLTAMTGFTGTWKGSRNTVTLNGGTLFASVNGADISNTGVIGGSLIENAENSTVSGCFTTTDTLCANSNNTTVTSSYYLAGSANADGGKTAAQFASGEVAWLLNTNGGTVPNTKMWSQGADYPVCADETNRGVVRVHLTGAKDTSLYLKSGDALPVLSELTFSASYVAGTVISEDSGFVLDLAILSAAPTITDSIAITYKANILNTLLGVDPPKMVFTFRGEAYEVKGVSGTDNGTYTAYTFTSTVFFRSSCVKTSGLS